MREPGSYDFIVLVIESCSREYSATRTLPNLLGHFAAGSGRFTKGAWVEGALRRLSVVLCERNHLLFWKSCRPSGGLPAINPHGAPRCPASSMCIQLSRYVPPQLFSAHPMTASDAPKLTTPTVAASTTPYPPSLLNLPNPRAVALDRSHSHPLPPDFSLAVPDPGAIMPDPGGRGDFATAGSEACLSGVVRSGVCVCSGFEHLRACRFSCLLRPSSQALLCMDVSSGAGGLPRHLYLSVRCVPVAPAVGDVRPYMCLGGVMGVVLVRSM